MSELTQTLKILVTRYPGTMAELARKASIDRSTLYKIVSGQRTPREFQLEHLTEALLTYLDDGHASDWLRSQKYTLDFIDYCLRLL